MVPKNKNTIEKIKSKLLQEEIQASDLKDNFLNRLQKKEKDLNAFISLTEDLASKQAKEINKKEKRKEVLGPLGGVPCAVKDNLLVQGVKCSAGSNMLSSYEAVFDATAIKKLKQSGAVILGKTNMDEFAMGSSTENSAFGPTRNPHDLDRVPGGSSGGSAAAVAAGEVVFALGSDTGGSVRQPAAFSGVVGLKPTYGTVSRSGLIAMASSLDVIGPITNTVEDARIVYKQIKGKDNLDATSRKNELNFPAQNGKDKIKLGIPKQYYQEGLDEEIKARLEKLQSQLQGGTEKFDFELKEVSLPHTEYALASYYVLMPAEVSSNLARYDGLRYAAGGEQQRDSLNAHYKELRSEKFGPEVKRRIILGTFSLSSGYYEDYYRKAQQMRKLIKKDFEEVFAEVDCLLTPTTPETAFEIGAKTDPLSMYLSDIFTVPANLAEIPALTVPVGSDKQGLPIGAQLMAPHFEEGLLFELGSEVERVAADWQ